MSFDTPSEGLYFGMTKLLNIQTMYFKKVQITEFMRKQRRKNNLHDLMESMMVVLLLYK